MLYYYKRTYDLEAKNGQYWQDRACYAGNY